MTHRLHLTLTAIAASAAAATALAVLPSYAGTVGPPDHCLGEEATIIGTDGDDDLVGTDGPDVVSLGAGSDTFDGLDGDDLICAGEGPDVIKGGPGNDEISADWGEVSGGTGNDIIHSAGTAVVRSGPGRDWVYAGGDVRAFMGGGRDRAKVAEGAPVVDGGAGNDRFDLWWEDFLEYSDKFQGAQLIGGPGRDSLWWTMDWAVTVDGPKRRVSSPGRWATWQSIHEIHGSGYADTMIGRKGHDHFFGLLGNDTLLGKGGNDELLGGGGKDTVDGGPGIDTCRAEVKKNCEKRP